MVLKTDTHFQRGFLMGMEAITRGLPILAPPWYREARNNDALTEFDLGVTTAYGIFKAARASGDV